mgnify:CR=1 FL=1
MERVLPLLDEHKSDHWDWLAIIAFYAALHWLDSYLAHQGLHPSNHRERNRAAQVLPIWDEYYELYAVSRIARYEAGHVPQQIAVRMRDQNLPAVRIWVQQTKQP